MMSKGLPTVLHIHFWADIRNSAGSVEKVITGFAGHGKNYRHMVACCPTESVGETKFTYRGIEVHTFRESRLVNRVLNKMLRLGAFTFHDLVSLINRLQPDILHFHNRQELVDPVVRRLAYRPAVLVHYHRHFTKPVIPKQADRLLFISRRTTEDILGKVSSDIPYDIVFNPLSLEVLERVEEAVAPSSVGLPPVILFGGGGNPIKGGRELIEAFNQLPAGAARLQMAGRNVEKLEGLPCPGVEVIGEVPAQQFFDLMLAADIVAMPSYDEPFGLIAQEAMLLRKVLVVAGSGGLTEFTDKDCAVVVRPKDVDSLKNGLLKAIALLSPEQFQQREAILAHALARVAVFQPQVATAALEKSYDNALANR